MVDMVEEMKIIDEARRGPQPQMVARFVSSTRCVENLYGLRRTGVKIL